MIPLGVSEVLQAVSGVALEKVQVRRLRASSCIPAFARKGSCS